MIVKIRQNTLDGIENIIICLYTKDMSVSDIEEQVIKLYVFNISNHRCTQEISTTNLNL